MRIRQFLTVALGAALLATAAFADEKGLDNHVKRDP